jgi:hypothetical protein
MESRDAENVSKRLVDAELNIWKKVDDIAYAEGKHPDEVYAELMIQFSEFLEKKYPTKKYPDEKTVKEQIRKPRSRTVKKATQNE